MAEGENILAIHGLNRNTTSSDFLIEARLTAGRDPDPIAEVQPNAIEYTGPVTLAGPANVFARAYDPGGSYDPFPYVPASQKPVGTPWSAPLQAIFYPGRPIRRRRTSPSPRSCITRRNPCPSERRRTSATRGASNISTSPTSAAPRST
ncbi:MAG: hypothetical protein R3F11_30750 [Verrucomicrobiales bacterium]